MLTVKKNNNKKTDRQTDRQQPKRLRFLEVSRKLHPSQNEFTIFQIFTGRKVYIIL